MFGIGITVALDRDRGLLQLKRALPMPPGIYPAAKLVTSMVFAAVVSIALMLMAVIVGKVVLELVRWASLFILADLGVIPFRGLGLVVGALVKGQSAVGDGGAGMVPHAIDLLGMAALFFAVARGALRRLR